MLREKSLQKHHHALPGTHRLWPLVLALAATALPGCSSQGGAPDSGPAASAFQNFLVIGVAGDYDSRAQFERMLVSGLRAEGVAARPYHIVVGGNKPLSRDAVLAAIADNDFDAVVITRVVDSESDVNVKSTVTGTEVKRKDGGLANLFRYDYEQYDDPLTLTLDMRVTFGTELYSAASQDLVWTAESTGPKVDNLGLLIDNTAETVVRQLRRARMIGRQDR